MKYSTTTSAGEGKNPSVSDVEEIENSLLLQIVVLGVFSVFGVAGNGLVLATGLRRVLCVPKSQRSRQEYRTSFISNLAVADILILVYVVPFHLVQEKGVPFSNFTCRFLVPLRETFALASILSIMAISVERTIAIIRPFALENSHRHTKYAIACIWISAYLLAGLPFVFVMEATETRGCIAEWGDHKLLHLTSAALLIIIPGVVTTSCYAFCLRSLRKFRQRRRNSSENIGMEQWTFVEQTRRVSAIAAVLVLVFWLCNLPFVIFALSLYYRSVSPSLKGLQYIRAIMLSLFFGTSVINPIVLIFMSPLYRQNARSCMRYIFSKGNAIFQCGRRRRQCSRESTRLEQVAITNEFTVASNEFALVTRRQSDV